MTDPTDRLANGLLPSPPADARPERDYRPKPCQRETWCVLPAHEGPCRVVPRYEHAPADFGPVRAVRR